jgi:hypothetical protein
VVAAESSEERSEALVCTVDASVSSSGKGDKGGESTHLYKRSVDYSTCHMWRPQWLVCPMLGCPSHRRSLWS